MSPEYLEKLADLVDPKRLWRMAALDQINLPECDRQQLDAGLALRRYADHVRQVQSLIGTGQSLLITPLSLNGTATKEVPMPESHLELLAARERSRRVTKRAWAKVQPLQTDPAPLRPSWNDTKTPKTR